MRSGMKASSAADVSPDPVMRGAGIRDRQSGVADETRNLSILKGFNYHFICENIQVLSIILSGLIQ